MTPSDSRQPVSLVAATDVAGLQRVRFSVPVTAYDGSDITLNGYHMPNEGQQPVILWPGFYQNGFCFDLIENGGSLAEYLWRNGLDLWVIHSRGTGGSDGRRMFCALDDFAASDIPAVIDYVARKSRRKPVYLGHSQGGNTALMSLMGACKRSDGRVVLSDEESEARQSSLKALVTLGSFLDFTFSKPSSLQDFVRNGVIVNFFGKRVRIIKSSLILKMLQILNFFPIPVSYTFRERMLVSRYLRILLAPLTIILNVCARLGIWEFLYHIPNVGDDARRYLFYRTQEGTFWGILAQHYRAIAGGAMLSFDGNVNYSENYHRLRLPVSFVSMELDALADAVKMKEAMFDAVSSSEKFYTEWIGQGHEDFFMNPEYFPGALAVIRKVC
jgi:pimeloyl-ACP methyl ester carboxylesterase